MIHHRLQLSAINTGPTSCALISFSVMALHQRTVSVLKMYTHQLSTSVTVASESRLFLRTQLKQIALCRSFRSTARQGSNSILNLSGLSISRESRFLSKERGIPRTEFSPHLELIRSSEVNPFTGKDSPVGSPSLATYSSPAMQYVGSSSSVSYLTKELENARIAKARSEAALRDLYVKYKSREKEASVLALVTTALTLGFLFSRELEDIFEPTLRQYQTVRGELFSIWNRTTSKLYNQEDSGLCRDFRKEMPEEHTTLAKDPILGPHSVWSKLFWASPD